MSERKKRFSKKKGQTKDKYNDGLHHKKHSPKRRSSFNFQKLSLLTPRSPYQEFHRLFKTVPHDQIPINAFSCALSREILLQGRMYVSQGWFCFYSNIFGWENQVTINCSKIKTITRQKTAYVVPNAILICVDEEKYFFSSFLQRETVFKLLYRVWIESRRQAGIKDAKDDNDELIDSENNNMSNGSLEDLLMEREKNLEQNSNSDVSDVDDGNSSPICPICGFIAGEILESECPECGILPGPGEFQLMDIPDIINMEERQELSESICTEEINHCVKEHRNLSQPSCGGAVLLASLSDLISTYIKSFLKYFRISRNKLFSILISFLVIILFIMSSFLMYRISVLEPKILNLYHGQLPGHMSAKQIWLFREELFQAQVLRFRSALAANVDAVSQVRETLYVLQQDLGESLTNCDPFNSSHCIVTK